MKKETNAIHFGHERDKTQRTMAVPIYQNMAYTFDSAEHAAAVFALEEPAYIYTRLNNPTNDLLEKRLAEVDGGIGAVSFASGTSAISTTFLTLLKAGDHIVASSSLYGGSYNMLNITLPRLGITTTFVNPDNPKDFEKAIQENTKLIFAETLGNPRLDVLDLAAISKVAKANKIPFVVDNTVATPALLRPIEHGVDIVIYSLTKYIGGQGNSLGGMVVDAGTFDWTSGKFPEFTTPCEGYHGLIYSEALGEFAFLAKLRVEGLRDFGAALSPYNAFQFIQGLETLAVRVQKHSKNAMELAKWLEKQEKIEWVNYPGLESSKYNNLAKKYLPDGANGVLTFGIKKGFEAAKKFINQTEIISIAANFGDTKSILTHPASTTHQQLTEAQQETTGVSPNLVRLSVGLENIEDLKQDITNALKSI